MGGRPKRKGSKIKPNNNKLSKNHENNLGFEGFEITQKMDEEISENGYSTADSDNSNNTNSKLNKINNVIMQENNPNIQVNKNEMYNNKSVNDQSSPKASIIVKFHFLIQETRVHIV